MNAIRWSRSQGQLRPHWQTPLPSPQRPTPPTGTTPRQAESGISTGGGSRIRAKYGRRRSQRGRGQRCLWGRSQRRLGPPKRHHSCFPQSPTPPTSTIPRQALHQRQQQGQRRRRRSDLRSHDQFGLLWHRSLCRRCRLWTVIWTLVDSPHVAKNSAPLTQIQMGQGLKQDGRSHYRKEKIQTPTDHWDTLPATSRRVAL